METPRTHPAGPASGHVVGSRDETLRAGLGRLSSGSGMKAAAAAPLAPSDALSGSEIASNGPVGTVTVKHAEGASGSRVAAPHGIVANARRAWAQHGIRPARLALSAGTGVKTQGQSEGRSWAGLTLARAPPACCRRESTGVDACMVRPVVSSRRSRLMHDALGWAGGETRLVYEKGGQIAGPSAECQDCQDARSSVLADWA